MDVGQASDALVAVLVLEFVLHQTMINMYVVHLRPVCASGTSSGVHLEDEMLLESLHLPSRQCRPFRPINLVGRRRKGGFTLSLPSIQDIYRCPEPQIGG